MKLDEFYSIINEAYFGKTEALLELEKAIGDLRKDYSFKRDYTATPEIKRIENAIIKQFNMEYFSLNIIPQNIPNAFTYEIGTRFDIVKQNNFDKLVVADQNNGYRFADGNGLIIIVGMYGAILADPKFTDAEIVAILLHEIGHNFSQIISGDVALVNRQMYEAWLLIVILRAISSFGLSLFTDIPFTFTNSNKYQTKKKEREKESGRAYAWMKFADANVRDFTFNVRLFFKRLSRGLVLSLIGEDRIMLSKRQKKDYGVGAKKAPRRQDEVIADKFAAIYGYGPEQTTALLKLGSITFPADEVLRKMPYGELYLRYNKEYNLDFFKNDPHPNNMQRINVMIDALEFELKKKNLDPKMRRTITSQLKEMKWIRSEYLKITENDDDMLAIQKAYDAYVNNEMPEAVTKELEKAIDKQIDDLCNKKY